jgi:hypothetical protein
MKWICNEKLMSFHSRLHIDFCEILYGTVYIKAFMQNSFYPFWVMMVYILFHGKIVFICKQLNINDRGLKKVDISLRSLDIYLCQFLVWWCIYPFPSFIFLTLQLSASFLVCARIQKGEFLWHIFLISIKTTGGVRL